LQFCAHFIDQILVFEFNRPVEVSRRGLFGNRRAAPLSREGTNVDPRINSRGIERTIDAVTRQIAVMGSTIFELGLFKPDVPAPQPVMVPRAWDADTLLRSVTWLRRENRDGRNIYIRPKGEHDLSLIDDLTSAAVEAMKGEGFNPSLVVETSPGNFQAWLKHPEPLARELSTATARALAEKFGGDRGAADWRHFGRLAGFTNRKAKYEDADTGLYPFVRLIEARSRVYPVAPQFIDGVRRALEVRASERNELREGARAGHPRDRAHLKSIEEFRNDAKYGGDGTRIDLAYAIYAVSNGASEIEVSNAIRSRDLSHKGDEKRRNDYVDRTIRKALSTIELTGRGR
jgi:hypothetical protein